MYATSDIDIIANIDTREGTIARDTSLTSAGTNANRGSLTREAVDRAFDELVHSDLDHSDLDQADFNQAELDRAELDRAELDQADIGHIGTPVIVRTPQARCADGHGTLSQLFFSDDVIDIARAKAICSKCKLSTSCLEGALDRAEPWGVWGGELIENGRIVVHKRPRGRPPKHPRPLVVIDECPIPAHLVA